MSAAVESDCADCEDYDFVCDGCGCGFCLEHASAHTVEECDRFRTIPQPAPAAAPTPPQSPAAGSAAHVEDKP